MLTFAQNDISKGCYDFNGDKYYPIPNKETLKNILIFYINL